MHLVSTEFPYRLKRYSERLYEARALADVLHSVRVERRSGVLTINFSQGSPAGTLKWTEPAEQKA